MIYVYEKGMSREDFHEALLEIWVVSNVDKCTCVPYGGVCDYCTYKFSLNIDDFVKYHMEQFDKNAEPTAADRYDRAMGVLK